MRFELRQQAIGVLGLGDDPQVVVRTQQIAHADQGEGVVVDEDDACFSAKSNPIEVEVSAAATGNAGRRIIRQEAAPDGLEF
ncbi:hypothetical protein P4056_03670 [Pseudomonas aeruginosa]|nr:hypothetical protein [Pseudomonas aeruginosa]